MNIKLLQQLSEANAVSGYEFEIHDLIQSNLNNYDFKKDHLNNLICVPKKYDASKKTVLLDAHVDEVGFLVQSIKDDGRINFISIGIGFDLSSTPVIIHSKNKIRGIIGAIPPHFKNEKTEFVIDVGTSSLKETLALGIDLGDQITFDSTSSFEEKTKSIFGKALDNRLGVFTILEVLKNDFDVNVIASFSAQEEVGVRGVQNVIDQLKVDYVIVLESTPADDIYLRPSQSILKNGVQVRLYDPTTIINPLFVKEIKMIVDKSNIKAQYAMRTSGGTNARTFVLNGLKTIILGVPTRYIHSSYALANIDDVQSMIDLTKEFINELK